MNDAKFAAWVEPIAVAYHDAHVEAIERTRTLSDEELAKPTGDSGWSVRDELAHMAASDGDFVRTLSAVVSGGQVDLSIFDNIDERNARNLDQLGDPLARRHRHGARAQRRQAAGAAGTVDTPEDEARTPEGFPFPLAQMLAGLRHAPSVPSRADRGCTRGTSAAGLRQQMGYDVNEIRKDFPILDRKIRRQAAGVPRQRGDDAEAAAGDRRARALLRALQREHPPRPAHAGRGGDGGLRGSAREGGRASSTPRIPEQEIIFTRNTTESINLVAHAWGRKFLQPGDEIVFSAMEHHSNLVPWQLIALATGAKLRFIDIDESGHLDWDDMLAKIGERTKIVAITQMSNVLGTINPIKEIAALAHRFGAVVLVDGAQSVPHMPVDVQAMDCDFLAFSAHKMLGPTGVGVLYGKRDLLNAMDPFLGGGEMIKRVTYEASTYADLPHKFEAGTPNIADVIAFGAAIDYLEDLGMDAVREHESAITQYAIDRLRETEGVHVYGPLDAEERGGAVAFNYRDLHPHDLSQVLDQHGIAIRAGHHCAQPLMRRLDVRRDRARELLPVQSRGRSGCADRWDHRERQDLLGMQSELELDELYRELILDHYKRPHHREKLAEFDVTAEGFNPVCGDEIEMELGFEGERLSAIGVRGRGCSISQASASMMSDVVAGKTVSEIRELSDAFTGMMRNGAGEPPEELGDIEALRGRREVPGAREVRDAGVAHAGRRHRPARARRWQRAHRRDVE